MRFEALVKGVWVLILAFAAGTGHAATKQERLLVLGDSLSAAYGLDVSEGWVVQLTERLAPREIEVINASISGETTSGGLSRLPRLLERHDPQWVLVELGANDGLRGLPLDAIRQNLLTMLNQVSESGARPILIGIMLPPNYGPMYADGFARMFAEIAEAESVPLVPFLLEGVATDRQLMQDDGLHPTAEAQPILFKNVWAVIEPLITAGTNPATGSD
ncbi:MAG: arylesterase [Halothiobacillaceae bacterium]